MRLSIFEKEVLLLDYIKHQTLINIQKLGNDLGFRGIGSNKISHRFLENFAKNHNLKIKFVKRGRPSTKNSISSYLPISSPSIKISLKEFLDLGLSYQTIKLWIMKGIIFEPYINITLTSFEFSEESYLRATHALHLQNYYDLQLSEIVQRLNSNKELFSEDVKFKAIKTKSTIPKWIDYWFESAEKYGSSRRSIDRLESSLHFKEIINRCKSNGYHLSRLDSEYIIETKQLQLLV